MSRFTTLGPVLAPLPYVVRMGQLSGALIITLLAIDCAHFGASADHHYVTSAQRLQALKRAQVWRRTNVPAMDIRRGPQGDGAFEPGATVTCDYVEDAFAGATPKFACAITKEDHVKVRYGRGNAEVFAGVAATRLLWALGFGADALYPVHVVCQGCPKAIAMTEPGAPPAGPTRFEFAAIERKMPGRELEAPSTGPGWAWPELDLVDERAGGAPVSHRDALKLLAVLLQHTDNKAEQQKLLCLDDNVPKRDLGKCMTTFLMVHDVGLTFGRATLLNRQQVSGANLAEWSGTPIWKDPQHCVGNLPPSNSGTMANPLISEAGRQFLSDLLGQLTDRQLEDLFTTARLAERAAVPGLSGGGVADWVKAFKKKRDEIAAAHCS